MKAIKVVHPRNLPTRLPFVGTAVVWLLLDRLAVDGVWLGVVYVLVTLWWVIMVYAAWVQEAVDLPLDTLETWTTKRRGSVT